MTLIKSLKKTKEAAARLASATTQQKNNILRSLINELEKEKQSIFEYNKKDVEIALSNKKNAAFIDRLTVTDKVFQQMTSQIRQIISQDDPIGSLVEHKKLINGVDLKKVRVAIGVIAIIYESRPNVTIDASALCIKSGNAVILKGGHDALYTNHVLARCVKKALSENGVSEDTVMFIEDKSHVIVSDLVKQTRYIDLVIPRGGYDLVQTIIKKSQIPVLYHASGGARIYIDQSANLQKALDICINAKTSRPATCNSLDTVVVHRHVAKQFLPLLFQKAQTYRLKLRGDKKSATIIPIEIVDNSEYRTEYLDLILSIKIVDNEDEAFAFIKKYSKRHSEGIIAEDKKVIQKFSQEIDAAALCINCSTRLHDGAIFELGAEMGIATGKLHARGPVGLNELTTYKWIAEGTGQIRK